MKKIILLILILAATGLFAQQDALYNQYLFNRLILNPAYSGSREVLTVRFIHRHQWVGLDGSPKTMTLSAHTPLRNESLALGFYVYSDKTGPLHDFGFMTNYAYRVRIGSGRLALGLQVGMIRLDLNWDEIDAKHNDDLILIQHPGSNWKPDVNFGIYYYTNHFFAGISSKHLLEDPFSVTDITGETVFMNFVRHFYVMTGGAIPLGDNLVISPSLLVKYAPQVPVNIDVSASVIIKEILEIGTSYRFNHELETNSLVFMARLTLGQRLSIGYSYDTYLTSFRTQSYGSHEIMLGYDINLFKPRTLTPRYF